MLTHNPKVAKLLIDNGADINAQDNEDQTAIFVNVRDNNIELVKLLIDNGADVNIKDDNEETLLMYTENTEIAQLLLDKGLNINEKNTRGETPLFFSSIYGNTDMVIFLLKKGARINIICTEKGEINVPVISRINKTIKK